VTVRVDFSGPAIGQVGHLGAGVLRFGGDTADDKSFAGTLAPGYSAALVKVPVG
jgi:hypothetical protein